MKLHPRHERMAQAHLVISECVTNTWETRALTALEVLVILAQLTAEYAKYPLREERHPNDSTKKADEA